MEGVLDVIFPNQRRAAPRSVNRRFINDRREIGADEAAIRAARRGANLIGKNDVKNALQEYYESRSTLNSEQFGPFSFAAPKEQPSN